MAKTKYDFIKELLEHKKINQNHRERIQELASKEINLEGTLEELVQRIEEIKFKDKMDSHIEIVEVRPSEQKSNHLPQYLNPYHLYRFLFEYNQNPILRTTCHDIDANELKSILEFCKTESYIFKEHLKSIITAYEEHEKAYSAPRQIKALIRGYLTGKDYNGKIIGWSSKNIKINWNSRELSIWASQNSNIPPNSSNFLLRERMVSSFKIDPQIKSPITEKVIQTFTQLVLHFKNLFHLKSGPQSLKEIIQRINIEKGWCDQVDFEINNREFSNNLEHFVDIEKLMQAYNKIIELIIEQHKVNEKPKVTLKYYEKNQIVLFSIHHLNGVYNKTAENTVERLGQTYASLIKNQINGLCNLRMKADFGNEKYAEVNLWDGLERAITEIPHFGGVEHFFEFPKLFIA
ncbi:MAG: hypothetical protein IPL25_15575 [Saprospiraceae bacterium]|nr:hypothetical protein [Candidatus Vicinibacter affinis]